jgi:hypothetical protein
MESSFIRPVQNGFTAKNEKKVCSNSDECYEESWVIKEPKVRLIKEAKGTTDQLGGYQLPHWMENADEAYPLNKRMVAKKTSSTQQLRLRSALRCCCVRRQGRCGA